MTDDHGILPLLGSLLDAGLRAGHDSPAYAGRIAELIGLDPEAGPEAAEKALRAPLGLAAETCELVAAPCGTSCARPAVTRLTGTCPHGHVAERQVCEDHGTPEEPLWCRVCYRLPEPGAHECPVALLPVAGPKPFRIRITPDALATVDRPARLLDAGSEKVRDGLGNWWHLAPPALAASCANCGADLTWSHDAPGWARADEPERGRPVCRHPDGTWTAHAAAVVKHGPGCGCTPCRAAYPVEAELHAGDAANEAAHAAWRES